MRTVWGSKGPLRHAARVVTEVATFLHQHFSTRAINDPLLCPYYPNPNPKPDPCRQDDDIPKDVLWADRITRLFRNHPRLAMLGGFRGRMDVGSRFDKSTGQLWGKKYGPHYIPVKMVDPKSRLLYMPMYKVNAAPLAVDRRVFAELGGFNANFSCVGDSGIDFDFEYSIRCVVCLYSPLWPAALCSGVDPSMGSVPRLVVRAQPQLDKDNNLGRQKHTAFSLAVLVGFRAWTMYVHGFAFWQASV